MTWMIWANPHFWEICSVRVAQLWSWKSQVDLQEMFQAEDEEVGSQEQQDQWGKSLVVHGLGDTTLAN